MARQKILLVAAQSIDADLMKAMTSGDSPEIDLLRSAKFLRADLITLDSFKSTGKEPVYQHLIFEGFSSQKTHSNDPVTKHQLTLLANACESVATAYDLVVVFGEQLTLAVIEKISALPDRPGIIALFNGQTPPKVLKPFSRRPYLKALSRIVTFDPVRHLFAVERLKKSPEAVEMIPPSVDQRFFHSDISIQRDPNIIAVVWSELTDIKLLSTLSKSEKSKIKAVVKQGITPPQKVEIVTTPEQRRNLWQQAGAVIFAEEESDYTNCFPYVVEAMACNAPIIITETMPLQHIIRDETEGLVVKPGDIPSARKALRRIIGNPDLATKLGNHSRSKVEEMLSLSHFANRLSRICRASKEKLAHREFYLAPNQTVLSEDELS